MQTSEPLILVVDDENSVLGCVSSVLRKRGRRFFCCRTAEDAISYCRQSHPDLIISDVYLDGMSGLEMCEHIKNEKGLDDIPVMFLSGAQMPDIIRRSHSVGGAYYLRKPIDPDVLCELVEKALWMSHRAGAELAHAISPA